MRYSVATWGKLREGSVVPSRYGRSSIAVIAGSYKDFSNEMGVKVRTCEMDLYRWWKRQGEVQAIVQNAFSISEHLLHAEHAA